jgi:GNAT superfamily N-acetyltransferase
MKIEEAAVNKKTLLEQGKIPISYLVDSKIDVQRKGSGLEGFTFKEVKVEPAYVRDYDLEEKPVEWLKICKIDHWKIFRAIEGEQLIGATLVALKSPEIHMLDGRDDLALIWDLRVIPENRRQGVGSQLFQAAAAWAKRQGCKQLKIETQNTNVKACRFYARQGCVLGEINLYKYLNFKNYNLEIMFCWYLDL